MKKLDLIDFHVDLPDPVAPSEITFRELLTLYLALAPHRRKSHGYRTEKWITAFGDLPAWDFHSAHILAMVDKLEGAGYKAATINREIVDIRAAFNWAIKKRKAPPEFQNPCTEYTMKPEDIRRVELTDQQINALLAAAKLSQWPKLYALVLMALHTGGRKGELTGLNWEDVSLEQRRAILHTTKNGRPRTLQLTQPVIDALSEIRPHHMLAGCKVFSGRNPLRAHSFRKNWETCRADVGLDDLHFHDLRHVSAAKMLKNGVNILAVTQILGHVDTRMISRRYGHLDDHHLQSAVEATWS